MTEPDRRLDDRLPANGLSAEINGSDYALSDISIGGAHIVGLMADPGQSLALVLKDGAERIRMAAVVKDAGPGFVSVEFGEPTYALMSCVARREAENP